IAFLSYSGNTQEVAEFVEERLIGEGLTVDIHRIGVDPPVDAHIYDYIFIGTFTWDYGMTPDEVKDFILEVGHKPNNVAVFVTGDTQFGGDELYCDDVDKLVKFYKMSELLLEKVKTLEPMHPNKSTGIFGGKSSGILNWNDIAYPHWYKMYKRLIGNYWQADEVNMSADVKQFPQLTPAEQDAYLKIIGLLSTLDAPQTRTALLISLYATDASVQSIM